MEHHFERRCPSTAEQRDEPEADSLDVVSAPDIADAIRSARLTSFVAPDVGRAQPSPLTVQAKLSVGAADDPSEREADAVASDVVAAISGDVDAPDMERPMPRIQRAGGGEGFDVDERFESEVHSSSGRPLPTEVRRRVEPAFGGVDFSGVRLHTGQRAQRLSAEISADAFTTANNVFIGRSDFDPSNQAGTELLAHELTHVVQQGAAAAGSAVQRRTVIQRRLTPDSDQAFTTAIRSNPAYATKKIEVDKYPGTGEDNVTEGEQKTLNDLSSTWKTRRRIKKRRSGEPDEAEQLEALTGLIRARNLSEFAERTIALKHAPVGPDEKYRTEKDKEKKRKFYLKKANEQKKKDRNLLRLGVAAPETREYLKEHGFTGAARDFQQTINPLGPKAGPQPKTRADDENPLGLTTKQDVGEWVRGPRIEVRSTFIGGPILGIRVRAHLFIVYTSRDGRQFYFRGGPDDNDFTVADYGPYTADTLDYDPSAPSVTVMEGPEAETKLDGLVHATQRINAMRVPYEAAIAPGKLRDAEGMVGEMVGMAVATNGENCNRTAWTILNNAGVQAKKPGGRHPGWGKPLGATIKGEREMEPDDHDKLDPPIDHVITEDEAGPSGLLQTYVDRAFYVKRAKVPSGTKVQIVAEGLRYRTLLIGSQRHFVEKTVDEQGLSLLMIVRDTLLAEEWTDDEIDHAIDDDTEGWAKVCKLADRLGVDDPNDVLNAIEWAREIRVPGREDNLLVDRLDAMGAAELREMAANLPRLANFARKVGVAPATVLKMVQTRVGEVNQRERIAAKIVEVLPTPLDLNRAVNDYDDYTVLDGIASELGASFEVVFLAADGLRPDDVQGNFIHVEVQKRSWENLVRAVVNGTADLSVFAAHLGVDMPFLTRIITGDTDDTGDVSAPVDLGADEGSGPVDWAEHGIAVMNDRGDTAFLVKLADSKPLLDDALKGSGNVSVSYRAGFYEITPADFDLVEKFNRGELGAPSSSEPEASDLASSGASEGDLRDEDTSSSSAADPRDALRAEVDDIMEDFRSGPLKGVIAFRAHLDLRDRIEKVLRSGDVDLARSTLLQLKVTLGLTDQELKEEFGPLAEP